MYDVDVQMSTGAGDHKLVGSARWQCRASMRKATIAPEYITPANAVAVADDQQCDSAKALSLDVDGRGC